jgi:hypothetical protein
VALRQRVDGDRAASITTHASKCFCNKAGRHGLLEWPR